MDPSEIQATKSAMKTFGIGPSSSSSFHNNNTTNTYAKNNTAESIKQQYKMLVAKHHPDVPGGSDSEMKKINDAYATLKRNMPYVIRTCCDDTTSANTRSRTNTITTRRAHPYHQQEQQQGRAFVHADDEEAFYETFQDRFAGEDFAYYDMDAGRGEMGYGSRAIPFDFARGFYVEDENDFFEEAIPDGFVQDLSMEEIAHMMHTMAAAAGQHPQQRRKQHNKNNNNNNNNKSRSWSKHEERAFQNMFNHEGRSFQFIARKLNRSVQEVISHYNEECIRNGRSDTKQKRKTEQQRYSNNNTEKEKESTLYGSYDFDATPFKESTTTFETATSENPNATPWYDFEHEESMYHNNSNNRKQHAKQKAARSSSTTTTSSSQQNYNYTNQKYSKQPPRDW